MTLVVSDILLHSFDVRLFWNITDILGNKFLESIVIPDDDYDKIKNGDGNVNTIDLAMLRKYLSCMDPFTGESSVVLGPK